MKAKAVNSFLPAILALLILVTNGGCASISYQETETGKPPINLTFAYHHPDSSFFASQSLEPWVDRVMNDSSGKINIVTYPNGSLFRMEDEYTALVSGLCDIALITPELHPDQFRLSGIDTLPMLFPNGETLGSVYYDIMKKFHSDMGLEKTKLLWIETMPPSQMISTVPIRRMNDLQGLTWRIEGEIEGWTMKALGVHGALIDTSDVYDALEKGLIDGINFTWEGTMSFGLHRITRYRAETNLLTRGFLVLMNLDRWNSLPADIQAVFEKCSGKAYSIMMGAAGDRVMEAARDSLTAYDRSQGNPEIYVPIADEQAQWLNICQSIWNQWAKRKDAEGLHGSVVLDETQRLVQRHHLQKARDIK